MGGERFGILGLEGGSINGDCATNILTPFPGLMLQPSSTWPQLGLLSTTHFLGHSSDLSSTPIIILYGAPLAIMKQLNLLTAVACTVHYCDFKGRSASEAKSDFLFLKKSLVSKWQDVDEEPLDAP